MPHKRALITLHAHIHAHQDKRYKLQNSGNSKLTQKCNDVRNTIN